MPVRKDTDRYEGIEKRVRLVAICLVIAMLALCIQFWRLQILSLGEFARLAESNRIWQKRLASDRGVIYAGSGEVLADNRASADVVIVPGECPDELLDAVCERLDAWISIDGAELRRRIHEHRSAPFTQLLVKRDVTKADRMRIEENQHALPGVAIVAHPHRRYLFGETAGHLLGYLGEINSEELALWAERNYVMGDWVGKDGLERYYEELLHGQDGFMLVTKYASGQPQLRTDKAGRPYIARRDTRGHLLNYEAQPVLPRSGDALRLTLDLALQQKCDDLLRGNQGAIVVLDADTGAVLAMASAPGYDPSVFVNRGMSAERLELLSGQRPNRMTHRAYREVYPPGSVYKIVLAAAALEEGVVTPRTRHHCAGHFLIDGRGRRWHCWRRSGHGAMNVVEALAFSCDVFFYHAGLALGVDRIALYSNLMGLGVPTGIDLPGEVQGLIPSREWKAAMNADKPVWEQQWYPGETVNLSIGQGATTSTPLQTAVMMACVINGGYRIRPYLWQDRPQMRSEKLFSDATMEEIIKGLRMCVEKGPPAPTGTGHRAYMPGKDIIGKTGTAQVVSLAHLAQYKRDEDIPYEKRHHAWFVAGVLDRTPRLAVSILIEHGHSGGESASPFAQEIVEFFYARQDEDNATILSKKE